MSSNLTLPAFRGSTVEVSILNGANFALRADYVLQGTVPGHDMLDIPCYSFLVENKMLGKKVLYDLGIMKAWKEKLPPSREFSIQDIVVIASAYEDDSRGSN